MIVEEATISELIKNFLVQQFPATKNIRNEDPLLKNGLIDSLGILEIVTFLENEFGITFTDENFESVRSLANFVRRKTNGAN
jgi:acyl carrier protein